MLGRGRGGGAVSEWAQTGYTHCLGWIGLGRVGYIYNTFLGRDRINYLVCHDERGYFFLRM